jgi:hypothetical protein
VFKPILKAVLPVAAVALAAGLSGCKDAKIKIDGEGVPLADLDLSGDPPREVILAGPDNVFISDGEKLDIDVSGEDEAVDAMRFTFKDGKLAIMRKNGRFDSKTRATVRITMPSPNAIMIAGSGTIEAASLSGDASATIAGSGTLKAAAVDAEALDVNVLGSGRFEASGKAGSLDLNIAGSGLAKMDSLMVGSADVTIAGSGDASFASDGEVEAKVMGSGNVTITGRATCTVKSMGSGSVVCKPAADNTDEAGDSSAEADNGDA